MKVEVIGCKGVVGSSTLELMKRLGHEVTGSDKGDEVGLAYIYLICTTEDAVPEVVGSLEGRECLIVVRSTTPPGTIDRLMKTYNRHICHWPEHLREATAFWDTYFPPFISIGECCKEHGDILASALEPMGMHIMRSDVITSEATKYAINCFKAVVVTFWNEFYELSRRIGFNPHTAARIAAHDYVVPTYGTILGKAYGGKCLPKDMRSLIKTCKEVGYTPKLIEATEEINNRMREEFGESVVRTG